MYLVCSGADILSSSVTGKPGCLGSGICMLCSRQSLASWGMWQMHCMCEQENLVLVMMAILNENVCFEVFLFLHLCLLFNYVLRTTGYKGTFKLSLTYGLLWKATCRNCMLMFNRDVIVSGFLEILTHHKWDESM